MEKSNSTCTDQAQAKERGYAADSSLVRSSDGYVSTNKILSEYYKPKDVFHCCYYSQKYETTYYDGYGLNFYTREYGYYEYSSCQTKEVELGPRVGLILAIVIPIVILWAIIGVCIYMYFKNSKKPSREAAYAVQDNSSSMTQGKPVQAEEII